MFCRKCGTQLNENATVCSNCGASLIEEAKTENVTAENAPTENTTSKKVSERKPDGMGLVAQILMILSCALTIIMSISVSWFCLISLVWMIPISISVANKLKFYEPIGTGLKVCTLLFVNTLAGILLLCRKEN